MELSSPIPVLVAALDLKLVRSIRDAIHNADIASGRTGPNGTFPQMGPRERIEPEPRIEPRKVLHPAPRIEPRFTIHPAPAISQQQTLTPVEPEPQTCRTETPLLPPWKLPIWKMPLQPAPEVKVNIHHTDVISKGTLIDLFI